MFPPESRAIPPEFIFPKNTALQCFRLLKLNSARRQIFCPTPPPGRLVWKGRNCSPFEDPGIYILYYIYPYMCVQLHYIYIFIFIDWLIDWFIYLFKCPSLVALRMKGRYSKGPRCSHEGSRDRRLPPPLNDSKLVKKTFQRRLWNPDRNSYISNNIKIEYCNYNDNVANPIGNHSQHDQQQVV